MKFVELQLPNHSPRPLYGVQEPCMQPPIIQDPPNAQIVFVQSLHCSPCQMLIAWSVLPLLPFTVYNILSQQP